MEAVILEFRGIVKLGARSLNEELGGKGQVGIWSRLSALSKRFALEFEVISSEWAPRPGRRRVQREGADLKPFFLCVT
jgi:hypothetical protein